MEKQNYSEYSNDIFPKTDKTLPILDEDDGVIIAPKVNIDIQNVINKELLKNLNKININIIVK